MKKNRVLRNWVITGLVGMVVTLVVLGLGVWFRDVEGFIGDQFIHGTNLNAIAWLPVISRDYWSGFLADAFAAFFGFNGTQGLADWSDYRIYVDNYRNLWVLSFDRIYFYDTHNKEGKIIYQGTLKELKKTYSKKDLEEIFLRMVQDENVR